MLALDDLHWADTASIEFVAHLLRRPPKAPVLLVVAVRPRQVPDALAVAFAAATVEGASSGVRLDLAPLSPEDSDALPGAAARDPVTRRRWYRESGGNPFYLEQLARTRPPPHGVPPDLVPNPASLDQPVGLDRLDGLDGPDDVPPAVTAAVPPPAR